ncbi:MAG: septal ring lytic transglycosylase RlpA family protein [Chromatiales bacterium]|nr:septal ring lytic transglycosylase RlpA family protein [Chromatiales bacterium]
MAAAGVETGTASWYGREFHGRPTSSREIYDMNDLTAAHRTLPFGTFVMVTHLANGRAVVVRINDRGAVRPRPRASTCPMPRPRRHRPGRPGHGPRPRIEVLKGFRRPRGRPAATAPSGSRSGPTRSRNRPTP